MSNKLNFTTMLESIINLLFAVVFSLLFIAIITNYNIVVGIAISVIMLAVYLLFIYYNTEVNED